MKFVTAGERQQAASIPSPGPEDRGERHEMSSEENTTSTGSSGRAQGGSQTRNIQQANPDAFLGRKQAPMMEKLKR